MKVLSGKQFAKILENHGWQLVRANGSHHVYMKPGNPARISLPVNGNEDLKIGLLKHFMKVANSLSWCYSSYNAEPGCSQLGSGLSFM